MEWGVGYLRTWKEGKGRKGGMGEGCRRHGKGKRGLDMG